MESEDGLKILIVEDEADTAKMLRLLLEKKMSASCEILSDCAALREILPALSTDLVTLDYQLPDGDGLALLKEINSTPDPPPVVMVTGHGDERTAVEAFREGASGYVVKDSRLSVLLVQEVRSALLKKELRNAELELMGREEMLQHIYESVAEGIIVGDPEGNFEYVNPLAVSIFGYDRPEEMIGTPIAERYANPSERDGVMEKLMKVGTVSDFPLEFRRKDGTTFTTLINAAMFKDANGKMVRTAAYTSYREQQAEAEKAKRLSEEKYRQMFDNMTSGIVVYRAVDDGDNFITVDSNKVVDRKIPRELHIGKPVDEFDPNAKESLLFKTIHEVWRTGELLTLPPTFYSEGNINVWVQGYAYKIPTGEVVATYNDVTEMMETQRALRHSEEMLSRVYDLAAEGIVVSDKEGRVEYANPHALELLGYSDLEEVRGEPTEQWYADPEFRKSMFPVLLEKGSVKDIDVEVVRKDGSTFWSRFNVSAEKDDQGNYVRGITFLTDNTRQKQAEDNLRKNEAMLRSIYDTSIEGILVTDGRGDYLFANNKAAELFGYENAEDMVKVTGADWYRYPDERDRMIKKLMEDGSIRDYEMEYRRKDGSFFWARVSGALQRDADGKITGVVGFMVDITEARKAEAELKASEMNLNEIYDRALEGIGIIDSNGNYEFMNQRHADIYGFGSPEEMLGTSVAERYADPEDRDKVINTLLDKGSIENYEVELVRKDGSTFWATMNFVVHKDEDGNLSKYSGFLVDITRRRKTEEELKRANEELEAYAHTVSHNLKGPLAAIALAADMLYPDVKDILSGESAELMETIGKNAAIGQSRIENLLKLAEYGQKPLHVEMVEIRDVVEESLKVMSGRIKARDINVAVDDDMGRLKASRAQIQMVFSNLIGNAVKHNDSRKPEIRIQYKGPGSDGIHRYLVCDNGSGIPEGQLEKIFIPFYKGQATGETGLGLSIARKISNLYGGDIIAYNDNGACFEATFRGLD